MTDISLLPCSQTDQSEEYPRHKEGDVQKSEIPFDIYIRTNFGSDHVVSREVLVGLDYDVLKGDAVQVFIYDLIKTQPDREGGTIDLSVTVDIASGSHAGYGEKIALCKSKDLAHRYLIGIPAELISALKTSVPRTGGDRGCHHRTRLLL